MTDVTEGLERLRAQEIQGGGVVAERPNEALFRVDLAGDHGAVKRERLGKTLRSDEILALKSAIAPVSGRARHASSAPLGTGIVHKKKKKGPMPASELRRLKKIAHRIEGAGNGTSAAASIAKPEVKAYDVWETTTTAVEHDDEERLPAEARNWVEPAKSKRPPATYGLAPEILTVAGTALPAVELAEAGQSYNPPIEAWNDLIARKAEEQVRLDAAQKIANTKSRAAQAVDERFELDPTSHHDDEQDDDDEDQDDAEATERSGRTVPTRATAKTQTQRNREARRARQIALEASLRARKAERASLAALNASDLVLAASQIQQDGSRELKDDDDGGSRLRRRKFGRHAVPLDPLELQLSHELAESLRTLRPEGNLFRDRFTSLVKRGILESRIPNTRRRRYALLKREKYSHKYEAGRPFMA